MALINPGEEVLLPSPFWVSYKDQIIAAGGKPVLLPMNPSGELDLELIKQSINAKTKIFVFSSPNNPSGFSYSVQQLKALADLALQNDFWLIADEIYERMIFSGEHHSIVEICPEIKDQTLLINGLSKGYAMTGWRVGYAAGPLVAISLIKKLQSHSSTCIPPFIEAAAIKALDSGPEAMKKQMAHLDQRRQLAMNMVDEIKNVTYVEPKGAFYLYLNINKITKNTLKFSEFLLDRFNVAAVPGEAFGTPGYLRLSYAVAEDKLREGLNRLKDALNQYDQ